MLADLLKDLISPRTDAGVFLQVALLFVLVGVGAWRTWHVRELRLLVVSLGVFVLGLMALRAAH